MLSNFRFENELIFYFESGYEHANNSGSDRIRNTGSNTFSNQNKLLPYEENYQLFKIPKIEKYCKYFHRENFFKMAIYKARKTVSRKWDTVSYRSQ